MKGGTGKARASVGGKVGQRKGRGLRSKTTDGMLVERLMAAAGERGNPKDWCVVSGDRMVDHRGSYKLPAPVPGVKLVFKRDLWRVTGREFADQFWSAALCIRLTGPTPSP